MLIRFANLVNRDDVRMIERRGGARFALESRASIGIGGERLRQNLDRDVASELRVSRAIHVAHSTGADERSDLVGSKALAGERRRVRLKDCGRDAVDGRRFEKTGRAVRIGEQRFELAPQRLVGAAGVAQERRALAFVACERGVIELLDVRKAI